jgi:hypothetical protein
VAPVTTSATALAMTWMIFSPSTQSMADRDEWTAGGRKGIRGYASARVGFEARQNQSIQYGLAGAIGRTRRTAFKVEASRAGMGLEMRGMLSREAALYSTFHRIL